MRTRHWSARTQAWQGVERLEARLVLAAVAWDGGGDGLRWEDPANWSGDALPGAADDVTVSAPGLTTVTHSSSAIEQVRTLNFAERLVVQGGGIGVERWWVQSGPLDLRGGALSGPGDMAITGPALWAGGTMTGPGRTIISGGGSLEIEGDVTLGRELVNRGLVGCWRGNLNMPGVILRNEPGAIIEWTSPGMMRGAGGRFLNAGELSITAATGRIDLAVEFTRYEAVIRANNLWLSGGVIRGGNMQIGGTLRLTGQTKFIAGTAISGAGTLLIDGGSHTFAGAVSLPIVRLESGAARFMPDQSLHQVIHRGGWLIADSIVTLGVGGLWWYGGVVAGPGSVRLTVSSPAFMPQWGTFTLLGTIRAPGPLTLRGNLTIRGGTLDVAGDLIATPVSSVRLVNGELRGSGRFDANVLVIGGHSRMARDADVTGYFGVEAGADIELVDSTVTVPGAPAAIGTGSGTTAVRFTGSGALRFGLSVHVLRATDLGSGILLDNAGSLHARAPLIVRGPVAQVVGGTLAGGAWSVLSGGPGVIIDFVTAPIMRNEASISITGPGAAFDAIRALSENAGDLTLAGGATLSITPASQTLVNSGLIELWGSQLGVTGSFDQTAAGTLRIRMSGQHASGLAVLDLARLDGALEVAGPAIGSPPTGPFALVMAASRLGQFALVDLTGLVNVPAGRIPALDYDDRAVRLAFVEA